MSVLRFQPQLVVSAEYHKVNPWSPWRSGDGWACAVTLGPVVLFTTWVSSLVASSDQRAAECTLGLFGERMQRALVGEDEEQEL